MLCFFQNENRQEYKNTYLDVDGGNINHADNMYINRVCCASIFRARTGLEMCLMPKNKHPSRAPTIIFSLSLSVFLSSYLMYVWVHYSAICRLPPPRPPSHFQKRCQENKKKIEHKTNISPNRIRSVNNLISISDIYEQCAQNTHTDNQELIHTKKEWIMEQVKLATILSFSFHSWIMWNKSN